MGRITDLLRFGKVFADLGVPPISPGTCRAMVYGSRAFNLDIMAVLENFGLREGANSDPREYVVERRFSTRLTQADEAGFGTDMRPTAFQMASRPCSWRAMSGCKRCADTL